MATVLLIVFLAVIFVGGGYILAKLGSTLGSDLASNPNRPSKAEIDTAELALKEIIRESIQKNNSQ